MSMMSDSQHEGLPRVLMFGFAFLTGAVQKMAILHLTMHSLLPRSLPQNDHPCLLSLWHPLPCHPDYLVPTYP